VVFKVHPIPSPCPLRAIILLAFSRHKDAVSLDFQKGSLTYTPFMLTDDAVAIAAMMWETLALHVQNAQ
jgi:hypothetical protein